MKTTIFSIILTLVTLFAAVGNHPTAAAESDTAERPNIILIFTDDQGYQDLGCFGSTTIKTPNLDRMAAEGTRLTSFYAQPVCGVSRAALMTGSYPIRIAEPRNVKQLHTVPHPQEITMAEVLGNAGYATALIGKWHLTAKKGGAPGGFDPATMPNSQGFDYFYGTPLFNGFTVYVDDTKFRSPIFRNEEVVVEGVESWDSITGDYTREALKWIEQNRDRPFFLYLAHNLPHVPVGASEQFKGKSEYGPYGDTIEEIDWSSGEIFKKLKELGIDEQTIVIFTSDNGPWVETTHAMQPGGRPFIPRDHSGSALPLRGWKMAAWDGGCRVPCIVRWPGQVPAGRSSDEILSTMDLLPTFAKLARAELPDWSIDGRDATDFLRGQTETSPRDEYLYYTGCLLTGVRSGQWKLVLPRSANPSGTGWWGRMIEAVPATSLYNLTDDPGETTDVSAENPEIVAALMKRIERARAELGDIDQTGSGARSFDPEPRRLQVPIRRPASPTPNPAPKNARIGYDEFKPLGDLRFTFEDGTLAAWEIVEGKLGRPVSSLPSLPRWATAPYNREGKHHLTTVEMADGFGDSQTAVVRSPRFTLSGDRASFLVSGGHVPNQLYVALVDAATGKPLLTAGGAGSPQMRRVVWDVEKFKDRPVYLEVVDRYDGPWGHLTFDDFSAEGKLVVE